MAVKRFRPKINYGFSDKFYRKLKIEYPQFQEYTNSQISRMIFEINTCLVDAAVKYPEGIELPEKLGRVILCRFEPNKAVKVIDKAKTKLYGQKIYHRNWETNGEILKIVYSKVPDSPSNYYLSRLWGFKACRTFTRKASAEFKQDYLKYHKSSNLKEVFSKLVSNDDNK